MEILGHNIAFTLAGMSRYRWSSSSTVATLDKKQRDNPFNYSLISPTQPGNKTTTIQELI